MAALIINSPFLTLLQGWMVRHLAVPLVAAVGRWAPDFKLPGSVPTHYGVRLHRQYRGEWEHNLTWKPSQVFSITAGWLRVIHTGHRRLLRGGAIILPIPVRHSNRLVKRKKQSKECFCADGMLKVQDIETLAPMLGTRVTVTAIAGGIHDLVLSRLPAREQVCEKIFAWLTSTFG